MFLTLRSAPARAWLTVLALAACAGMSPAQEATTQLPPPRLFCPGPVFTFRPVERGRPVRHTFVFHNAGGQPLQIRKIDAHCGCTATLLSRKKIPSGEQGSVGVTLDTREFAGWQSLTVDIHSNDPDNPVQRLTVRGKVISRIAISPRFLILNDLDPNTAKSGEVSITSVMKIPLQLGELQLTGPFEARLRTRSIGKSYVIEVTAKPQSKPGQWFGVLTIPTNHPSAPIRTVDVTAVVPPAIGVTGPTVLNSVPAIVIPTPILANQQERRYAIHLRHHRGPTPNLDRIETSPAGVVATIRQTGPENWVIDVRVPGSISATTGPGFVRVQTGLEEQPVIEVPIAFESS